MRKTLVASMLAGALLAAQPAARAAQLDGARFDDTVSVGGQELRLNGLGLKSLFIVKSYVAALYVPRPSHSAAELISQPGPRRLSLHLLMDQSASRLPRLFDDGIGRNHADAQLAALKEPLDRLRAALAALGGARKGERLDFDFVDGTTRVSVNGQPRGEPIPGAELQGAILRAFLGERPADRALKAGLLGGA